MFGIVVVLASPGGLGIYPSQIRQARRIFSLCPLNHADSTVCRTAEPVRGRVWVEKLRLLEHALMWECWVGHPFFSVLTSQPLWGGEFLLSWALTSLP